MNLSIRLAPLVRYAFEAYATGIYSIHQLLAELTDMGLTHRATANRAERPLYLSNLHQMLRNPYYIGMVPYKGVQDPGRHQPLISPALFEQVQTVLTAHNYAGEKQRIHHHFLKGTIVCGRCGSRMCFAEAKGNGGIYPYFFCLNRAVRKSCDLPYLPVDQVAELVAQAYAHVRLTPDEVEELRGHLLRALEHEQQDGAKETKRHQARITKLEQERRRVADLAFKGAMPEDLAAEKQTLIRKQLAKTQESLAACQLVVRR